MPTKMSQASKRIAVLCLVLFCWNSIALQAMDVLRYRYAYSADGFNQDRDDVAASAMTLALFDKAGLSNRLVHFHFNTNFGGEPKHAEEHRKSVLQTAVLFGIIKEENGDDGFFDVSRSVEERQTAIAHLAKQIRISCKSDPLIMICAGGVQTYYMAMQKAILNGANKETLKSITFLSHGRANERTSRKKSDNLEYHSDWNALKKLAPEARFIDATSSLVNGRRNGGVNQSQNSAAWNQSPRNRKPGVLAWQWLKDYGDHVEGFGFSGTKGEWLLERLRAAGAPEIGHNGNAEGDASDAGMVFGYVLGQPTDATMEDIKAYFFNDSSEEHTVHVFSEGNHPMVQFALNDLNASLSKKGMAFHPSALNEATIILVDVSSESIPRMHFDLKDEGFSIKKDAKGKIWIIGADEAGTMYGALELAEQVRLNGLHQVKETKQNPYMATRGMKFNIPLDLRTPTYSDPSEASQQNMLEMWSMDFWTAFIDTLARHRYNLLSLWSLHPFPSMIKVPEYPDVALDDVWRTKDPIDRFHNLGGGGKYPDIMVHTEVIKEITIDEKIDFWRRVMRYAKDRNVDIYLMTWNIFDWGLEGKYGITAKVDNPVTKDYYRKSVKQMLVTYPDLAGIGLTVGENMAGYPSDVKEKWAFDTYGQGLLDAAEMFPDRNFAFIHRLHQGQVQDITQQFAPLIEHENIDFLFSYKYAKAHVMSSTVQPFCEKYVEEIKGMKTLWTLRNDDNFYFRWGAPGFVRAFIKNIPYAVSQGFYYGSDGYIWGREFLAKKHKSPRQLEVEKHWYHWMSFGRLGYNPDLLDDWFVKILQDRFPEVDGQILFQAWQEASLIYPLTTGFHWGAADFSWYIEGSVSHPAGTADRSGLHTVDQFIKQKVHAGTQNQPIPDYVKMVVAGERSELISPLELSKQLHRHADRALTLIETVNPTGTEELAHTLADIQSISFLGKHYAYKIRGATHLALYREMKNKNDQKQAIEQLEQALVYWEKYTDNATKQYINPVRMKRVGDVDWVKFAEVIRQDIEIAKEN